MLRQLMLVAAVLSLFAIDVPDADAARRRGFFRRARVSQSSRYRTQYYRNSRSQPLHMTHSRSAVLDSFSGVAGHDRSWYVGR